MSEENVELIRGVYYEALSAGPHLTDLDAALAKGSEYLHPDVEVHDLQPAPGVPDVVRGMEAQVRVLMEWVELFDNWSVEVRECVDLDPWVICDVQWRATASGSDVAIDWRVAEAHEVKDGRITREVFGFPDLATAVNTLEQGDGDLDATLKDLKASQD